MLTEARLREVLARVGPADVSVWRDGIDLVARVLSPTFAGKDEHVRQFEVWSLLLDNLTDEEHAQVAFVFTHTPEEEAEAQRDAAAG